MLISKYEIIAWLWRVGIRSADVLDCIEYNVNVGSNPTSQAIIEEA
uniref:Uncharacterized protein n=1 Tax=viral metagenome TaxID=1070528 RepID=A0A6M3X6I7_9ZZZZ